MQTEAKDRRPLRRVDGLLLIVSLAAGLLSLNASASLWWSNLTNKAPRSMDFLAFYTAGQLLRQDPAALYNLDRQLAIETTITAPYTLPQGVLPYNYPAHLALLLAPLSLLPFAWAYAAATALNALLFIGTLILLSVRLRLARDARCWLFLAAFCSTAAYATLLHGQTSILVLLLLSLFITDLMAGREARAGVWLGLLAFKPQFLLVPLFILMWERRWRVIVTTLGIAAVALLISWLLVGSAGLHQLWLLLSAQVAATDGVLAIQPLAMHNLRALVRFVLPSPWDNLAWAAAGLFTLALVLRLQRGPAIYRWGGLILGLVLLAPHFNTHDLIILLLPSALLLADSPGPRVPPGRVAAILGVAILPFFVAALWNITGVNWPVVPVVLLGVLCAGVRQMARVASKRPG